MYASLFAGRGAKRGFVLLASALLISSVVVCALAGGKGNQNPGVLPPDSKPHGASYGVWGDRWWQWALSVPAATNPVSDTTGEFAAMGQSGSVWFLAGTFGGGNAERTVTVPPGKALFIPIYNWVWVNLPELGDAPWSPEQEAFARALIGEAVDSVTGLSCEIDGRAVQNITTYRCQTPEDGAYMVYFPEGDVWGLTIPPPEGPGLAPGWYGPSVSDGYYLMLAPLSAGKHTIHFTAAGNLDVTYHLTVKREGRQVNARRQGRL